MKLLFVIPTYTQGGTNRSLQFLLSTLKNSNFEIYILCLKDGGIYQTLFANYNIIKKSSLVYFFWNSTSFIAKIIRFIDRMIHYNISQIVMSKFIKSIEKEYQFDKVIAYEEGIATYITSFFNNSKKLAWVHCDYQYYKKKNNYIEKKTYNKIEYIICVSKYTSLSFIKHFPQFKNKVNFAYNILDTNYINKLSELAIKETNIFNEDEFNILSIGRFDPIKQFSKIPQIVNTIIKNGKSQKFKWYIIGSGKKDILTNLLSEIEKYNLKDIVILLGAKENPYPYIKKSNLLVSTSYSEACPYVINEAKVLHIPVLSTNYKSATELITEDNGIITTINDMPFILYNLINNINIQYTKLNNRTKLYTFNTAQYLNKVINILEK